MSDFNNIDDMLEANLKASMDEILNDEPSNEGPVPEETEAIDKKEGLFDFFKELSDKNKKVCYCTIAVVLILGLVIGLLIGGHKKRVNKDVVGTIYLETELAASDDAEDQESTTLQYALSINKDLVVYECTTENEEDMDIFQGITISGEEPSRAIKNVVGAMYMDGDFSEEDAVLSVSIQALDNETFDEIFDMVYDVFADTNYDFTVELGIESKDGEAKADVSDKIDAKIVEKETKSEKTSDTDEKKEDPNSEITATISDKASNVVVFIKDKTDSAVEGAKDAANDAIENAVDGAKDAAADAVSDAVTEKVDEIARENGADDDTIAEIKKQIKEFFANLFN